MRTLWLVEDPENQRHWIAEPGGEAVAIPRFGGTWFRDDVRMYEEVLREALEDGDGTYSTEGLLDDPKARVVATWTEEEGVRPYEHPLDPEPMVPASARYLGPDSYRHLGPEQFRTLLIYTARLRSVDDLTSRAIATALLEASPIQLSGISTTILVQLLASQDAAVRSAAMRRAAQAMEASQRYRSRLPR